MTQRFLDRTCVEMVARVYYSHGSSGEHSKLAHFELTKADATARAYATLAHLPRSTQIADGEVYRCQLTADEKFHQRGWRILGMAKAATHDRMAIELLPRAACPSPELLDRFTMQIERLTQPTLRRFADMALMDRHFATEWVRAAKSTDSPDPAGMLHEAVMMVDLVTETSLLTEADRQVALTAGIFLRPGRTYVERLACPDFTFDAVCLPQASMDWLWGADKALRHRLMALWGYSPKGAQKPDTDPIRDVLSFAQYAAHLMQRTARGALCIDE